MFVRKLPESESPGQAGGLSYVPLLNAEIHDSLGRPLPVMRGKIIRALVV
jgi:hypothetical protein